MPPRYRLSRRTPSPPRSDGVGCGRKNNLRSSTLPLVPLVELSFRFLSASAVALLDLADYHLGIALHLVDLIVSQLAPLLADFPLKLQPLTLECVAVSHLVSSRMYSVERTAPGPHSTSPAAPVRRAYRRSSSGYASENVRRRDLLPN